MKLEVVLQIKEMRGYNFLQTSSITSGLVSRLVRGWGDEISNVVGISQHMLFTESMTHCGSYGTVH